LTEDKPAYQVRPARSADFPILVDVFNRVFRKDKDLRTLKWKYLENPHGKSVVWVAESAEKEIVGSLAFVPHRMLYQGKEYLTFLASDGMVFPDWQRHGIFIRLLNIMFDESWSREAPFVIAFSGRRSVKGLIRTDWDEVGLVQELILPLRGRRLFKGIIRRLPFLAGPVAAAGDCVLNRGRLKLFLNHAFTSEVKPLDRFTEEHARVAREGAKQVPLSLVRDEAFLNWRYLDNPTKRHRCFSASRNGKVAGFMVMEAEGDLAYMAELVAPDPAVRIDLVARAVLEARNKGAIMLQCMALAGDPVDRLLRSLSFRGLPQEGLLPYMIKMAPAGDVDKQVVTDSRLWYLCHGDKDAEHMTP
jgi:hypothetical protein